MQQQEPARVADRQGPARPWRGNLVHPACARRHALRRERTDPAAWPRAEAHRRAKVHQSLRVAANRSFREQRFGKRPEFAGDRGLSGKPLDAEAAREHTPDVAVQDRRMPAKGEHGDRRRSRSADAGQLRKRRRIAGETACMHANDPARGRMKVSGARVIAKAAPETQHLVLGCLRQRLHVGKSAQKALVIGDHRVDARLLQHHLGEPDAVRIARTLPGKVMASVAPLPADELASKIAHLRILARRFDGGLRFRHHPSSLGLHPMLAFIVRRLAQAVLVMLAVGLIAFSLFRFVGDPVIFMLGQDATPEDRERITKLIGLDQPFYVQYASFLGRAVQGNFGLSLRQVRPVSTLILERLPATLELSFVAAALALVAGIVMGVYTALRRDS